MGKAGISPSSGKLSSHRLDDFHKVTQASESSFLVVAFKSRTPKAKLSLPPIFSDGYVHLFCIYSVLEDIFRSSLKV